MPEKTVNRPLSVFTVCLDVMNGHKARGECQKRVYGNQHIFHSPKDVQSVCPGSALRGDSFS